MKIYNTLTRKLEEFEPLDPNMVTFYYCGPTVYWTQHIGNLRGAFTADTLHRTLKYLGYGVNMVRNYTDVGHLTSDGDTGEDKMAKGAAREKKTPDEIAKKYIEIYEKDTLLLNILEPNHKPRATEYVSPMIEMIKVLLDKGFAYQTELAIYFDVKKFPKYYDLSKQKPEEQIADLEDPTKHNPQDFVLWFFKTGKHKAAIQTWASSWGEGFPGWHLECSVMAKELLGPTIDIHWGGVEHISVHHTNEIAQSEAANGVKFVQYWAHNEHLLVDDKKMAKSEGTSFSLSEILDKGFNPMDLRYLYLQAHYRSQQNFTWESLAAAKTARNNLLAKAYILRQKALGHPGQFVESIQTQFKAALENDLNVSSALALVWELLDANENPEDIIKTLYDFDQVLGLKIRDSLILEVPRYIYYMAKEREELREAKQFAEADVKRQAIENAGYVIEDSGNGFFVRPAKF